MQALSRVLETDGVCKSAFIGVLAIHLTQRERQLNQILRGPSQNGMHSVQSIEAGEAGNVRPALLLGLSSYVSFPKD